MCPRAGNKSGMPFGKRQRYLGRSAADSEVEYWVDQFVHHGQTNEDLVSGFVSADEYFQRNTAP